MQGNVWQDEKGNWYLKRCPECLRENYALAVTSGTCCWCGYDANAKQSECSEG